MAALVGARFTHHRLLDPSWRPGPGERYADAPHAEMVVTRVTAYTVWATSVPVVGDRGVARVRFDRAAFLAEYGTALGIHAGTA